MPKNIPDRIALAEQWRQLGKTLRERSPSRFAKLLDLLAGSLVVDADDDGQDIGNVYRAC